MTVFFDQPPLNLLILSIVVGIVFIVGVWAANLKKDLKALREEEEAKARA